MTTLIASRDRETALTLADIAEQLGLRRSTVVLGTSGLLVPDAVAAEYEQRYGSALTVATVAAPRALAAPRAGPTCLTEPAVLNLCIYRGDTSRFRLFFSDSSGDPYDVSGAAWDADIRVDADDAAVVENFSVTPVVGQTNAVDVMLTADQTAGLTEAAYVYDIEMTLVGDVRTVVAGALTVTKDVSRP